ncbi:MAG: DUF4252 domain-containing protein [Bacteroidales bacterium]
MKQTVTFKWMIPVFMLFILSIQGNAWHEGDYRETTSDFQMDKVARVIEKYANSRYGDNIKISSGLLSKLSGAKNTDNLVKNITGLNILSVSKSSPDSKKVCEAFKSEIRGAIKNGYSNLMNIKSKGNDVDVYIEDSNSQIVMLIDSPEEFTVLNMDGVITSEIIKAVMNGDIKINR